MPWQKGRMQKWQRMLVPSGLLRGYLRPQSRRHMPHSQGRGLHHMRTKTRRIGRRPLRGTCSLSLSISNIVTDMTTGLTKNPFSYTSKQQEQAAKIEVCSATKLLESTVLLAKQIGKDKGENKNEWVKVNSETYTFAAPSPPAPSQPRRIMESGVVHMMNPPSASSC